MTSWCAISVHLANSLTGNAEHLAGFTESQVAVQEALNGFTSLALAAHIQVTDDAARVSHDGSPVLPNELSLTPGLS